MRALARLRDILGRAIATLLDLVAVLLGTLYAARYAAIVRRLGLSSFDPSQQPGLIIIQVDGLGYVQLRQALDEGRMPYLQRLLRHGEFVMRPWHVAIPTTTPASEAGIMFGNNDDIPGFRWYDKARNESVLTSVPGHVLEIQDRISAGHPGILAGGASSMNMFDGDASEAMFTLGAFPRKRFFNSVRGLGFLLLFLLNPFRSAKVVILAVWEYLTDTVQRLLAILRRRTHRPSKRTFTFLRVMSNVVLREIQTFEVLIDIYRGVPAIYTTYLGYDQLAHHYDPTSRPAFRALNAIDARIHRIDHFRRLQLSRPYDLYVLSDHGMTPSEPFEAHFGCTLGDVVRQAVGESVWLDEAVSAERQASIQAMYVGSELEAIEGNVRPPFSYIPRRLRVLVAQRTAEMMAATESEARALAEARAPSQAEPAPQGRDSVVVRSSGSLSHVYFPGNGAQQLNLSEIMARYPYLIPQLVAHEGIWLVIGREGSAVTLFSDRGSLTLGEDSQVRGENPLARQPRPHETAEELRRLALFGNAGDLVLIGDYDPESDRVYSFEEQWGSHGAIGGAQETAFLVLGADVPWDIARVRQSPDLYALFRARYAALYPEEKATGAAEAPGESPAAAVPAESEPAVVDQEALAGWAPADEVEASTVDGAQVLAGDRAQVPDDASIGDAAGKS